MKRVTAILFMLCGLSRLSFSQGYTPVIEPCPCPVKIDPRLGARCGNLVVPENRRQPQGRTIKVPFLYVWKPGTDTGKHALLFTTGGPGYSTLANYDSITTPLRFLQFGPFIAFNQRGARLSQPCLDCPEVTTAIQQAYRHRLSKDSLVHIAVRQCRKRLSAQGIDLSAYNTIESAADINDLRLALGIDSLTLFGISYSGGLMLTVARNHPEGVRALILGSPLPGYVNYEEHALLNHNEALELVFDNCEADSAGAQYNNLRERFHRYFASITGRQFNLPYVPKGSTDTLHIQYTKKELLDAVINRMNTAQLKTVPYVMNELVNGRHEPYIREILDGVFAGNNGLSHGMRYSIYCSEQIAYADQALGKQQEALLPWLAGHAFNNVDHAICDCWQVKPEPAVVKTPLYSNIPALITAGDADPWCRPFYNRLIRRYMPHAQLLTVHNQGHIPSFMVDGVDYLKMFMEQPYRRLGAASENVTVE